MYIIVADKVTEEEETMYQMIEYLKSLFKSDSKIKQHEIKKIIKSFHETDYFECEKDQKNLIGFNNGILDLENLMEFREGFPEDLVTLSCKYDFKTYDKECVEKLENYLESIFDKDKIKVFYEQISKMLLGNKEINVWISSGGNGKTTLLKLLKLSFGDYFKPKSKSFVGKNNKSNYGDCEGVKIIGIEEVQEVDVATLKYIHGGDFLTFKNHGHNFTIKSLFSSIITCNVIPTNMDMEDESIKRRINILEFKKTFTSSDKIPVEEFKEMFVWLIFNHIITKA